MKSSFNDHILVSRVQIDRRRLKAKQSGSAAPREPSVSAPSEWDTRKTTKAEVLSIYKKRKAAVCTSVPVGGVKSATQDDA